MFHPLQKYLQTLNKGIYHSQGTAQWLYLKLKVLVFMGVD